ncbi:hypothetical protein LTR53_019265, partial [Teratosphaeriaceae sp. CCFEE 6253]
MWDLADTQSAQAAAMLNPSAIRMSKRHIESITTCAPARPQMLLASSADGTLSVANLDDAMPVATTVNAKPPLNDVTSPLLLWHDFSQRVLSTDDNCEVSARPLRKRKRLQQPTVGKAASAITAMA